MSERVRSTNRYKTMAFVDYFDRPGEYREVELTGPISEAHYQRGHRLRDARIAARLTLKEHADRAALPEVDYPMLSKIQMGQVEATEEEWAALWAALGRSE